MHQEGAGEADREAPVGPGGEETMGVEANGTTIAMVAVLRDPMTGTVVQGPMIGMAATMNMVTMIDVTATTIMTMMIGMTATTVTIMMIGIPTTLGRGEAEAAAPAERDMGEGPGVDIQDQDRMKGVLVKVSNARHLTIVGSMNLEGAGGDHLPSREIGMNAEVRIMGVVAQSLMMAVAEIECRKQTVGDIETFGRSISMP